MTPFMMTRKHSSAICHRDPARVNGFNWTVPWMVQILTTAREDHCGQRAEDLGLEDLFWKSTQEPADVGLCPVVLATGNDRAQIHGRKS
jgi:hypothetical protein